MYFTLPTASSRCLLTTWERSCNRYQEATPDHAAFHDPGWLGCCIFRSSSDKSSVHDGCSKPELRFNGSCWFKYVP